MVVKMFRILLSLVISMGIGFWIMISGWGLEPQSWGVIIGGSLLNWVVATALIPSY